MAKKIRENADSLPEPARGDAIKTSNTLLASMALAAKDRGGISLSQFDFEALHPDWSVIEDQIACLSPIADALEISPAKRWDLDTARRSLDDLFDHARQYRSSLAYRELIDFIARFRTYSPFNAMLIHTQMKGARFVATPHRWAREYGRRIKTGAQPVVILQPKGPIMFVFDVSDTEEEEGAPPLPPEVDQPFQVKRGRIGGQLEQTIENAKRDGILVIERPFGSQRAGSIQCASSDKFLDITVGRRSQNPERVPLRYELFLNSNHSTETRYATLVHELAHLYCGHLGTPNETWWPDRRGLELTVREFEAESVCYLVCERLGIINPSEKYLAGYLQNHDEVPPMSLHCLMKTLSLIQEMGVRRLSLRKWKEESVLDLGG